MATCAIKEWYSSHWWFFVRRRGSVAYNCNHYNTSLKNANERLFSLAEPFRLQRFVGWHFERRFLWNRPTAQPTEVRSFVRRSTSVLVNSPNSIFHRRRPSIYFVLDSTPAPHARVTTWVSLLLAWAITHVCSCKLNRCVCQTFVSMMCPCPALHRIFFPPGFPSSQNVTNADAFWPSPFPRLQGRPCVRRAARHIDVDLMHPTAQQKFEH
jgi:hypothetical protein